jgi:hypothetical protein
MWLRDGCVRGHRELQMVTGRRVKVGRSFRAFSRIGHGARSHPKPVAPSDVGHDIIASNLITETAILMRTASDMSQIRTPTKAITGNLTPSARPRG